MDKDVKQILKVRDILSKLKGNSNKKRKRDNADDQNPLVAYVKALLTPHQFSHTKPNIPFKHIEDNLYDVEGNPPIKMLEVTDTHFEFL